MNLYYLAPELSLTAIAVLVILLDLFIPQKQILAWVAAAGLVIPAGFAFSLWGLNTTSFYEMLAVDNLAIFFKLLIMGIAALTILASLDYAPRFANSQGEYYALVLFAALGLMLLASTRELISIYIALELSGLSLYALSGMLRDRKSTEAGLKFLLLGAVSSAVLLYGMALVFGLTGATELDRIAAMVPQVRNVNYLALLTGIIFMVAGFGFKLASVPFQMWVPDVYEGAPTPVTAYLSVASKAAGFAVVLRVFNTAFGDPLVSLDWSTIFAVLAVLSMTLGNVVAIAQTNIKRMLAYSSIAQAGYLLVGLATVTALGRSGVAFFLAGYAVTNLGAFIAIIAITNKLASDEISGFAGMARRAPLLALALALCLVSLTGIPPTVGFIAKLYIFSAAVQGGLVWLVIIAVLNAVISASYYLRVVKVMYLEQPLSEERVPSSVALRLALTVACVGVLVLGVMPEPLLRIAELAVITLSP